MLSFSSAPSHLISLPQLPNTWIFSLNVFRPSLVQACLLYKHTSSFVGNGILSLYKSHLSPHFTLPLPLHFMQDLIYPNNTSWLNSSTRSSNISIVAPSTSHKAFTLSALTPSVAPFHKHKNKLIRKLAGWILGILVRTLAKSICWVKMN